MIIIQDTREKEPWSFSSFSECKAQIVQKVDTGDYIIQDNEYLITIDRKKKISELANNLGMNQQRFEKELQRMQDYVYRYILCEFPYKKLLTFPKSAGLPKQVRYKIRITGKFLVKQVDKFSEEYGVEFLFCNNRIEAQEKAMDLFKEALEYEDK